MKSRFFLFCSASFLWLAVSFIECSKVAYSCTMKFEWVCKYRTKYVVDLQTNKYVYRSVYGCENEPNFCAESSENSPLAPVSPPGKTSWTGWKFCNKTNEEKLSIAYTYHYLADWITKGWVDVPKGKCVTLVSKAYGYRAYFHIRNAEVKWTGRKENVCFDSKKDFFLAYLSPPGFPCLHPNESAPFNEIDTVDGANNPLENWTTNITVDMILKRPIEFKNIFENLFKDNPNIFKDLESKP